MEELNIYEPTDSELEILQILWDHEPATVRFVFERIKAQQLRDKVGYTTILKQMQRLAEKGVVRRELVGKTHYYRVVPKKVDVQQKLLRPFLKKVYEGSSVKLIMHALGQGDTTPEELEELQNWLEEQKRRRDD